MQRETLEITHKELAAEMKKAEIFKRESKEKDAEITEFFRYLQVFVETTAVHRIRRQVAGSPRRDWPMQILIQVLRHRLTPRMMHTHHQNSRRLG